MRKLLSVILWSALMIVSMPLSTKAGRADYRVIPLPKSIQTDTTKVFTLQPGMAIAYDASNPEIARTAQMLCQWVEQQTGLRLQLEPSAKKAAVRLAVSPAKKGVSTSPADSYSLTVGKAGITISAAEPIGIFRGVQTLRKSLPSAGGPIELPFVTIADEPRFSYRGVHLDCARHYFPVAVVKQYLDLLALHGCNQLHWHITDDQGWRFEVKALPDLAAKGSIRQQTVIGRNTGLYDGQPYGGYYTQDECREIVRYAAERYINVIPEIDLPGHMQAALHVYPNLGCTGGPYPVWQVWGVSEDVLCAGNPDVLTFIKTVLGELCDVFPSRLIHIGGDECPKVRWKNCPKCQAKIRELQLKDDGKHSLENQLQSYINHEVEKFLTTRGRNLIGWDETLEGGLTEGAVVMSWRGVNGGIEAARQHHRVIMAPTDYCYIDYYQLKDTWNLPLGIGGYVPASKVYSFEPLVPGKLTEEEQQYILGPQVNLWTEYIAAPEHLFFMLLPRLDAISEVQWCQPGQKDFDDFKRRLPRIMQLYDRLHVSYCRKVE
ncbi:MAG: beta-N-acetylhexosaminidase [Prevotella sp.]|nr:beta-N-acetylhexosaminidase [Prevotella sp.]